MQWIQVYQNNFALHFIFPSRKGFLDNFCGILKISVLQILLRIIPWGYFDRVVWRILLENISPEKKTLHVLLLLVPVFKRAKSFRRGLAASLENLSLLIFVLSRLHFLAYFHYCIWWWWSHGWLSFLNSKAYEPVCTQPCQKHRYASLSISVVDKMVSNFLPAQVKGESISNQITNF